MAQAFLLHPFGTIHPRGAGLIVARSAVTAPPPDAVCFSPSTSDGNWQLSLDRLSAKTLGKTLAGDVLLRCTTSASSGYFEILVNAVGGSSLLGLTSSTAATASDFLGNTHGVGYSLDGNIYHSGSSIAVYSSYTTGDVIGVARKGNFLYFSKNGVWQNSADPSAGTGGIDVSAFASDVLIPAADANNASLDITGRFTAASMAFAIPSGVTAWDGTTSSSSVTVALTGQSLSIAQGSLLASTALALTGQSLAAAQGSVAPATSEALSGQSLTGAQGTLSPGTTGSLTGQVLSVAQGSVIPGLSFALSGQALTLARGTLTPSNTVALTGLSLIIAGGTVTVGVTAALVGQSLTAAQGSVGHALSLALSGHSLVVTLGNVTVASSDATASLTGQGMSLSLGILIATVVNGPPQLRDIIVNGENLVNEPPPLAGSLNLITEPSGQIVNHPPYPPAELA